MRYLIYNNSEILHARNRQIAIQNGCTGDITTEWFGVIKHPHQEVFALCIDDESLLDTEELTGLKSYEEMQAENWFEQD